MSKSSPAIGLAETTAFTPNVFHKLAPYYDLVHASRDYEEEAKFLEAVLRKYHDGGTRMLELFCGTGGHTIPMAQKGFEVVGLDSSSSMLAIAEKKAHVKAASITFRLGDCRWLGFTNEFECAFGFGQSVHYLISYQETHNTFRGVNRALKSGGLLVFDIINGWKLLEPYQTEHYDVGKDGTIIVRIERTRLDRLKRVKCSEMTWIIQTPTGRVNLEKTVEGYRVFFQDELDYLLTISGFELLAICGDYDLDRSASLDSLTLSLIARKLADLT